MEALTVVLADGTPLRLERSRGATASGGRIALETKRGRLTIPVPEYHMPPVAKVSAGYYAAPEMDPIDLFIGCEGTLGVVTEITFRALTPAPQIALAFVTCTSEAAGMRLVTALRDASRATWR